MGNESGSVLCKLVDDYKHFKIHEEPGLIASNMFRDYVLPSTAAITLVTLIGEIAYMKKLKELWIPSNAGRQNIISEHIACDGHGRDSTLDSIKCRTEILKKKNEIFLL